MFVAALFVSGSAFAGVKAPKDANGSTLPTIDFVGAETCRLTSADSTNGKSCSATPAVVYGVLVSSDSATNYMVFRDSATANTSSTVKFVLWNDDQNADEDVTKTLIHRFPVPVKFSNGISANVNAAISAGTQSDWIVIYRPLTATE
jgi:hypothetical protein